MHAELFADFLEAFRAGNVAANDAEIGRHADAAHGLYRKLIETPATDMAGVAFQLAAGQIWEGSGASFRDDAAAAAYRSAVKATGLDPLAAIA